MLLFRRDRPSDASAVRNALYAGEVILLPPTPLSLTLVADALSSIEEELADAGPIRQAQHRMTNDAFFARMGRLRKRFYLGPPYHQQVRDLLAESGFPVDRTAFDPIRLRVVTHRGFEDARAAPVYYAHRDTWYANSQSQLTWWIPLHDLTREETFVFYPEFFCQPVPNDSEVFDYDDWTRRGWNLKIGWQDPEAGRRAKYPTLTSPFVPGETVSFECRAGSILMFAGAHLHQTVNNVTGQTRFSLDFRTVDQDDHRRGLGAVNVDNRSRGADSALREYVQPQDRDSAMWLA
jgi:hypothetical protein